MNHAINKTEIQEAAIQAGEALAAFNTSALPSHVFSAGHESAMQRILSMAAGRKKRRPVLRHIAAAIIAIAVLFAGAYAFIPSVHAAVNEWFFTVWNNTVEYFFPHSGNDHAFPVMTPTGIPERFTLSSDKSGDGYRTLKYTDSTNGDYITFDYRWINEKRAEKLKQDIEKNCSVTLYHGYNALLTESRNKTTLKWYNPQNMLGFSAESNIPANELIQAFSEMDGHLPDYEPTWVPEGFELIIQERDLGSTSFVYMQPSTSNIVALQYFDYGNEDTIGSELAKGDVIEEITINGWRASLIYTDSEDPNYDSDDPFNGLVLIWTDENNHLIFMVVGAVSKDTAVSFAESVKTK